MGVRRYFAHSPMLSDGVGLPWATGLQPYEPPEAEGGEMHGLSNLGLLGEYRWQVACRTRRPREIQPSSSATVAAVGMLSRRPCGRWHHRPRWTIAHRLAMRTAGALPPAARGDRVGECGVVVEASPLSPLAGWVVLTMMRSVVRADRLSCISSRRAGLCYRCRSCRWRSSVESLTRLASSSSRFRGWRTR